MWHLRYSLFLHTLHSLGGKGAQNIPAGCWGTAFPHFCAWGVGTAGVLSSLPAQFCDSVTLLKSPLPADRWGQAQADPAQLSQNRARDSQHPRAVGCTHALIQTRGGSASHIPAVLSSQRLWLPPALPPLCAGDRLWRAPVLSLSW